MDNDQLMVGTFGNNTSSASDVSDSLDCKIEKRKSTLEHKALTNEGHCAGMPRKECSLGITRAAVEDNGSDDRDNAHGKVSAAEESVSEEAKEEAKYLGEESNQDGSKSGMEKRNSTDSVRGKAAREKKQLVGNAKQKGEPGQEEKGQEQQDTKTGAGHLSLFDLCPSTIIDEDDSAINNGHAEGKVVDAENDHLSCRAKNKGIPSQRAAQEDGGDTSTRTSALVNSDAIDGTAIDNDVHHPPGEARTARVGKESGDEAKEQGDHSEKAETVVENDGTGGDEEEEDRECRVCRGDDEGGTRPLANPCACSGSIKYVHQVNSTLNFLGWNEGI